MADESEQKTLQDLFRVINDRFGELRTEIGGLRSEMHSEISSLRDEMNARFDEASAEREAMRSVIDTLPSEDDFQDLDRKIAVIANDTKATRTDVRNLKAETSRLRADVKAAGIPVR